MPIPNIVAELVQRFENNYDQYKHPSYNETQVRLEFLDPFFEALGWDVHNKQGHAQAYKDVIHEDAIKVGSATKAPDYSFRIGGTRKFFVEAKKPSVYLKENPEPAYQLRRYAWSAKLPVSILTDFEEFVVYDCRKKPKNGDKASDSRLKYYTYRDYHDKWDEIAAIFSREAVLKGSFDKYAETRKGKRGTSEVDGAFLAEIESWREVLAKNLAQRNDDLSQKELNFAVQRIIDRIIFLRMCEDRGVEDYGTLQHLLDDSPIYDGLKKKFHDADDRYNSGIFHFTKEKDRAEAPDTLTPKLKIDDKTLKQIIGHLYYPESPYEFSVLPPEILGQVYEQFLGKIIRLTSNHQAKVEDKPEVRKAGGVYYTPAYIVDYIVKNTVGKLLENKTPKEAAKLRILDPACGSGSFLVGAYQYLLTWHRDWYVKNGTEKNEIYQGKGGQWYLAPDVKQKILLNNIYGVDIDAQAVEVTKLSLLLKVLEDESKETLDKRRRLFHERALPDLGSNIKCGNSLIGTDFYDEHQGELFDDEERERINVFDWNEEFSKIMNGGGFDAVIGNPPYDVLEKERGAASWPHFALTEYVRVRPDLSPALGGKTNLFRFFLVRSIQLIKRHGRFGMIMPLALLADTSCSETRLHLLNNSKDIQADCFPQKDNAARRVFLGAKLSTGIVVCEKRDKSSASTVSTEHIIVRTYPWNSFSDPFKECSIQISDLQMIDRKAPIPLLDEGAWSLCRKIHKHSKVKRVGDCEWIKVTRGEINQTVYRQYIKSNPKMARLLKGVEVGQYHQRERLKQGIREWFDEEMFLKENDERKVVHLQRIATQRITGVDERLRIVATVVQPPCYFADSTNSVVVDLESDFSFAFILGLFNSSLFQWRFKATSTNNNVGTNELEAMPVRLIDFANQKEKQHHDKMVKLVERMLEMHKKKPQAKTPQEITRIERDITNTEKEIDQLVYELYGLTKDEIKIVEESTQ